MERQNFSIDYEPIEPSNYISTLNQKIECNTSSESNKTMARWWFQRCGNDHPHCTPVGYPGRKLPKRLLEVGNSSNGLTVKLIETQPLRNINYMTLSHCWGGTLPISLLTANLEISKTDIPFSSLPKTFQDALSVVGWFGIKYLWIDALCIIQDSDDDWAHESSRMRDYYKYSFGTVAATGASNSSEGLFFDRNPAFVSPFRAIISPQGKEQTVEVTAGGSCLEVLGNEPLNRRGWFLQERFLSPRVLHFGRMQMSWECRTKLSCETWPNIVPSNVYIRSSFALISRDDYPKNTRALWCKIVSTYSRMALTRLSDRCVAFAGIAEEFQAITRDEYVAGLWRRDLVEELLWQVDKSQYPKDSPARAQLYLAPSWSWLSLDRAVRRQENFRKRIDIMAVISARVESVTENRFGAIKNGVIGARGLLVPAICTADNGSWGFHSIRSEKIRELNRFLALFIDEGYIEEPDRFLYCLPILDEIYDVHGLLVVPTYKMTAQYRRIGTFAIQKPHAYDLLQLPKALNGGLNGPEFQNLTLV
ncbi:hypothetical protein JMJ35_004312 [Cladonia borealis]|uniref:Heterokaryon incompatibility domain-containing protein n=1 Tax=Cladonia borealis TaxID=184061 RepID=A0AA39UBD0_9LECA|nr:hypothetical protein JMJ35_004312 [Cladonia borealis]